MEYVFTADGLTKQYKHFKALDSLSMHIEKGAIYGFVGKNGAGKTTLIRVLCGLQEPTAGTYELYGTKNTDRNIHSVHRRLGAVVETPSIYLEMTARQNIEQQYLIMGLNPAQGVQELLTLVGLENTGKKKAKNFSLGMRQRLGIAVALAGSPDFLVLDEPVNGLDPEGIIEIRELILKLNRENNITFLISSHILDELSRLATHYGFINNGKMVKEMSAVELESAFKKSIRITLSSTENLAPVLQKLGLEHKVVSATQAEIYSEITATRLVSTLAKENIEVLSIHEQDESLESYYIDLVGGEKHD